MRQTSQSDSVVVLLMTAAVVLNQLQKSKSEPAAIRCNRKSNKSKPQSSHRLPLRLQRKSKLSRRPLRGKKGAEPASNYVQGTASSAN